MSNCEFDENVRHVDDVDLNDINDDGGGGNDAASAEAREETLRLQQHAREVKYENLEVVCWLAKLAHGWQAVGSIPATSKLFSLEPAGSNTNAWYHGTRKRGNIEGEN